MSHPLDQRRTRSIAHRRRPRSAATRRSSCRACAPPRRATSTRPSPSASSCARAGAGDRPHRHRQRARRSRRSRRSAARPRATLVVDLQENYRLAASVGAARRQDPLQPRPPAPRRARQVDRRQGRAGWSSVARDTDSAVRIGVNCGSVAPEFLERYPGDQLEALVQSALYHCAADGGPRLRPLRRLAQGLRSRARSSPPTAASPRRGPTCRSTSASPRPACRRRASSRRASPSRSCSPPASATRCASR